MDDRLDMVEETRHEYGSYCSQIKVFTKAVSCMLFLMDLSAFLDKTQNMKVVDIRVYYFQFQFQLHRSNILKAMAFLVKPV